MAAWVSLAPVALAARGAPWRRRAWLGLVCGTVWSFGLVGVWLWPAARQALPIGSAAAVALAFAAGQIFGGLYMVLFCLAYEPCRRVVGGGLLAVFAVAALWTSTEVARGHVFGGLPWGLIGYSQWRHPSLIQIADAAGVHGVSFLIAFVNASLTEILAVLWSHPARSSFALRKRVVLLAVATVLPVALALLYGQWRLAGASPGRPFDTLVISSAWDRIDPTGSAELLDELIDLTGSSGQPVDLIVWPEASLRFYLQRRPDVVARLRDLGRARGASMLLGGLRFDGSPENLAYYNAAFLIASDEPTLAVRDKRILVPLAESQLPPLPAVPRAFSAGRTLAPLPTGDVNLGVLICFEAIFPAAARGLAAAGADVFINLTNDVLLGAGAEQMAAMSVFRSVENRVPLVRVANMGPSLLVDSYGRIVARERGFSAANWRVELSSGEAPPYRAIGDYFGSFFAVVAVLAIGLGARSGVPGVAYPGANERSQ